MANCVWWIAAVTGLDTRFTIHIDNLWSCEAAILRESAETHTKESGSIKRAMSATPRDLTEDQRIDSILGEDEHGIEQSKRARNNWQRNRVNPIPQNKRQIYRAMKVKRCQKEGRK